MSYALINVTSPSDWEALHGIRCAVLFAPRHPQVVYDSDHPDDRSSGHYPLLLMYEGEPIGVVRLDALGNGLGAVRLVAIVADRQGQGHGRMLGNLVEDLARSKGLHTLFVNAAANAVGYYTAMGWERHVWDADELTGIASDCVQMRKPLSQSEWSTA